VVPPTVQPLEQVVSATDEAPVVTLLTSAL